jgi:hypothetical protein
MTRMLVAYEPCGCLALALLDPSDAEEAARFREESAAAGLQVREEERELVGAEACAAHAGGAA